MSGQCDLFSEMSPALVPGDIVQSHGKPLTFDDLLKREGALVVLVVKGLYLTGRVGAVETIPGSRMFQKPRRRITIFLGGSDVMTYLFRADMKGDSPKRVYEL